MSGTTSDGAEDAIAPMNPAERALAEQTWAELTERLKPEWQRDGRMAKDAFFAYLAAFPTMAVEMLPMRYSKENGELELWMSRRDPKDPFPAYAGRWHSPGCMLMPGMTIAKTLERVVEKETHVGFQIVAELPPHEGNASPRGFEIPIPFIVHLLDEPKMVGQWFPLKDLPLMNARDELIQAQYESFIASAADWAAENRRKILKWTDC